MNEREIVDQRIVTLSGLLDTPGGPLGPSAGSLGRDLAASWDAERRLLQRILRETPANDVRATIAQWHERTAAFVERSTDPTPSWKDRDGNTWDAREVLRILEDIRQRIEIWLFGEKSDDPNADKPEASNAGTSEEDDEDGTTYVNVLRPDSSN